MSWQELYSEITIGTLKFRGVHEVRVKRSIHSYADAAWIKVPSIAVINKGNRSSAEVLTTGTLFKENDPVTIKLGYNGKLQTEFEGFVKRLNLNMPLEIECEGYVRRLRLDINVKKFYDKTSAKELLELLTKGKDGKPTGISVVVADNIPLINVKLPDVNGVEIIDAIKRFSEGMLTIFFITPTTLWCGLTYTPYTRTATAPEGADPFNLGQANYRLGWNVVKDNGLKERVTSGERVQILFHGTLATGKKLMTASDDKTAKRKDKSLLNNIGSAAILQKLANEKQYRVNYAGYEGAINCFLVPYCLPGYKANVLDARYPERNGVYMVESTDVVFGVKGARRRVELGPRIGFDPVTK